VHKILDLTAQSIISPVHLILQKRLAFVKLDARHTLKYFSRVPNVLSLTFRNIRILVPAIMTPSRRLLGLRV